MRRIGDAYEFLKEVGRHIAYRVGLATPPEPSPPPSPEPRPLIAEALVNPEVDRLAKLFAAAVWDVLPGWARIVLRVGWPLIVQYVVPAIIRLFALEQHAGIRGGNMAAIKVYDDIEDIARDAPADLVRALERAKSR